MLNQIYHKQIAHELKYTKTIEVYRRDTQTADQVLSYLWSESLNFQKIMKISPHHTNLRIYICLPNLQKTFSRPDLAKPQCLRSVKTEIQYAMYFIFIFINFFLCKVYIVIHIYKIRQYTTIYPDNLIKLLEYLLSIVMSVSY